MVCRSLRRDLPILNAPRDLALGPGGSIYVNDSGNASIRVISNPFPGMTDGELAVADGSGEQFYVFDPDGRHQRTVDSLLGTARQSLSYDANGFVSSITDVDGNVTRIERTGTQATAIVAPGGQRTTLTYGSDGYLASITDAAGQAHTFQYGSGGLLARMTDPRSNVHSFQYDDGGRLLADSDPAGGSKTLTRNGTDDHYAVDITTAEGRASSYQVDQNSDGSEIREFTDPAGLLTITSKTAAGQFTTFSPDGSSSDSRSIGDPRFGLMASFPESMTLTEPGLGQLTASQTRSYVLSGDPSHPVASAALTFTLNGRTSSSLFSGPSRNVVQTSPAGRTATLRYDPRAHLTGTEIPGIAPIGFGYDATGLATVVTQLNRTIALGYDAQRRLHAVTDPLHRTVLFDYDAADRITRQTLPDGRTIGFAYDANGNLLSIVPPGRPPHLFVYTPVDLASNYSPPTVPNGGATQYTYNRDQQLTLVSRPDGRSVSLGYHFGRRLSTLAIARRTYGYTYDLAGRLASVTAPDGGSIAYAYNGSLLQSATSTGEVSGSINWTYDIDLAVTSEAVACASAATAACQPVAFSYDADKLLTGAGALTLTRDPHNGLLSAATAGSVTDAWTYNTFGEPLTHTASLGAAVLLSEQFQRDDVGRIAQKTETVAGTTATASYTYDNAGRLIDVAGDTTAH